MLKGAMMLFASEPYRREEPYNHKDQNNRVRDGNVAMLAFTLCRC